MTTVLSSAISGGSGLTNYGELKEATASWLNRTDIDENTPLFVRLAETSIRRDVRCRAQEEFEDGTATAETIPMPELMLEARRFTVGGKLYSYITPEQFQDYGDRTFTTPRHFTIIGQNIYVLGGATDQVYSLLYWKAFAAFVNDTDTNWLMLNAPEIYLWASCKEGAEWLKDYEAANRFAEKYQQALSVLNATEKAARHSGGVMKVRVAGATP